MLSDKEIDKVERFISKQGIRFLDFKYEVLDHILSDIEAYILMRDLNFDTAFIEVKKKWKPSLETTSNLWFGLLYSCPKIVMQKCTKLMNAFMFKVLLIVFGLFLAVSFLGLKPLFLSNLLNVYAVMCVISTLTLLYHFRYFWLKKEETTFSYCYKKSFSCVPLYGLVMFFLEYYYETSTYKLESITLLEFLFFTAIYSMSFVMFSKHKTFLEKFHIQIV